jgi:hypothetical protein
MASAELSRRVGKAVAYPPLSELSAEQRRDFHEALLDADTFEDLSRSRALKRYLVLSQPQRLREPPSQGGQATSMRRYKLGASVAVSDSARARQFYEG